jgi:NADPH-dependent 2,4-dienoyl-CoA reductase/sulfur reductase-like enzyme
VIPPLSGVDLPYVFTFKTIEDMDRVYQYLEERHPQDAVIVGGGLIGMEVMENLGLKGLKVSIVEKLDHGGCRFLKKNHSYKILAKEIDFISRGS